MITAVYIKNSVPEVGLRSTERMMSCIHPSVPSSVVASKNMTKSRNTNIGRPNEPTYRPNGMVGITAKPSAHRQSIG
jgi:hypothetical protein